MNLIEAQELLDGPLIFGSREQIEAANFLAEMGRIRAIASEENWVLCLCCEGAGQTPECGECLDDDQCDACSGGWIQECGLCNGIGLLDQDRDSLALDDDFSNDAVLALISDMTKAKQHKSAVGQC